MSRARRLASATSSIAPSEPGTSGRPSAPAVRLASTLSPIVRICSGLGPIQIDIVRLDDLGEARILAEEAVAGVDRVGVRDLGRRDDVGDVEIGFGRARRADADRLVGQTHVHRVGVGGRMDRDRLDAHFVRGAVDAQRDLAAIGDQDLFDVGHGRLYSITTSGWPNSTGSAFWTRMRVTVPARGAWIWFITFIASMITNVSPSSTRSPTLTNALEPGSADR